jgi:DNA polymerase V
MTKMPNRFKKKHYSEASVFWAANPALTEEMLSATPVEQIWGIGGQQAVFLTGAGFKTAADLAKAPGDWIEKNLSVKGLRLVFELRGIPAIAWEGSPATRKNICTSRSFGHARGKNRIAGFSQL